MRPSSRRRPQAFRHVAGWYFAAPYGVYATRDGHIAISLSPLRVLAEAIGEPRLAAYTDKDTWTKQDEISELIAARAQATTTAEWVARMEPLKIWHAPRARLCRDRRRSAGQAHEVAGHGGRRGRDRRARDAGQPSRPLRRRPPRCACRPSRWARRRAEVLKELGLGQAEIEALARDKVVTLPKPR